MQCDSFQLDYKLHKYNLQLFWSNVGMLLWLMITCNHVESNQHAEIASVRGAHILCQSVRLIINFPFPVSISDRIVHFVWRRNLQPHYTSVILKPIPAIQLK